jgi:serine/threonine-protein kinase
VHRDVSPHNVLIGVDGIARITDFGVAHAETRLSTTKGGQVKGKFAYMSPEQVRSMPIDRRSDVYAAGVVLWETMTGQRMLRNDNDLAMITQILGRAWKLPHELAPSVPRPVSDACTRALSLEPGDRYATAAAFAEALEEAARASGVTIASARGVSQFIKELNAHDSPGELPTSGPLSGRSLPPSVPPPSMRSGPRSVKTPVPGGVYDAVMAPGALAGAEPVPISTQKGAVITSTTQVSPAKERRAGARALMVVAALAVGGGVGWAVLSKGGEVAPQGSAGDRAVSAAAGTSGGAPEPPKSAPSAPAPRDEPAAAPSPSLSPTSGAADSADAGADASAPFPAPGVPGVPGRPAGKPLGSPAAPPVFRPREL